MQREIGLLVAGPVTCRMLEDAARDLRLQPVLLSAADERDEELLRFTLIVADELPARALRSRVAQQEGTRPAIVAVVTTTEERLRAESDLEFEGVLVVPETPAVLTAQLSAILHAALAFQRRYQSVLEEVRLSRQILQSVTSGISVADATAPDMPLIYVNPGFEAMTGYARDEVIGKNCRFLQGDLHEQVGLEPVREAVAHSRETVALLKNFRKDGSAFWNELYLSPMRDQEGKVTHFVGIQMDVTERVDFEVALRSSEKLAAVGRLASSIAHEINNPLGAVMNLIYLAQQTEDPNEIRSYLEQADGELRRVKLITSQSLRFYRQSTQPQAILPAELLGSVADMHGVRLRKAHIGVERRDRTEQTLVCLESEIRQVLNNLLSNAIDAMALNGGRLQLRSRLGRNWRTGQDGFVITVSDTGGGMSPETRERIFEAFFTTKESAGTGLGLWISKDIVARHAGRLSVRSSQRGGRSGTVFQLFLPREARIVAAEADSRPAPFPATA